jgi:hypothetical protein
MKHWRKRQKINEPELKEVMNGIEQFQLTDYQPVLLRRYSSTVPDKSIALKM